MIKTHIRGHEVYYDKDSEMWRYCDNNGTIDENRECKRCGCKPTKEGYDVCIGHIEGVTSACCGHGVDEPINVK